MRWLREWLRRIFGKPSHYIASTIPEPPDVVRPWRLYLIGEPKAYWLAVLQCPCGCGDAIQLPLSGRSSPRWTFSGSPDAPSLRPSVRRSTGCRSHFILRGGHVVWCSD